MIAGHHRRGLLATHWTLAGASVGQRPRWSLDERIAAAADAGFEAISFLAHELVALRHRSLLDEVQASLERHGVVAAEVEFLSSWADRNDGVDEFEIAVLDAAREMGIAQVNAGLLNDAPHSLPELGRRLGRLAREAEARRCSIALEFVAGTAVPDLGSALAVIESSETNIGLIFDVWHAYRSGVPLAELSQVPASVLRTVQLSDAPSRPLHVLTQEMVRGRLLPGEGDIPLTAMIAQLDSTGASYRASVEIMSDAHVARTRVDAAHLAWRSARDILMRAGQVDLGGNS